MSFGSNVYLIGSANFNFDRFYIPATGVVYTLDFSVPVKEEEKPEQDETDTEAETDAQDDLWQQTEDAVRTGTTSSQRLLAQTYNSEPEEKITYIIDEEALGETVDVIVNAIGKYGSKIDDLDQNESIIVVAQVTGSLRSINVTNNPIKWRYLHADTPRQRLILNFPVSELQAVAAGRLDLDDLKDRVSIAMYDDSPTSTPFGRAPSLFAAPSPLSR